MSDRNISISEDGTVRLNPHTDKQVSILPCGCVLVFERYVHVRCAECLEREDAWKLDAALRAETPERKTNRIAAEVYREALPMRRTWWERLTAEADYTLEQHKRFLANPSILQAAHLVASAIHAAHYGLKVLGPYNPAQQERRSA